MVPATYIHKNVHVPSLGYAMEWVKAILDNPEAAGTLYTTALTGAAIYGAGRIDYGANLMTDEELRAYREEKDWYSPVQNLKAWKYGKELDEREKQRDEF